jgi:prevent-host-death family protein
VVVVNMHEAKTHLSNLVQRAEAGEEIVIGRAGRPAVRLVPCAARAEPRRPGILAGRMQVADDFDETPEWLVDAFERGEAPPARG